ncbi:flagellar hook-length control protein FliK [Buchnera aphidicola (Brevicoryne brassicae)]|nr:flagellar hook-length control protein FliK [Buchnera aphidicola]QCI19661.1 flagellar hook-length control protein FliK [Buchnera aphidicola (Brevicoryne brassicae)]
MIHDIIDINQKKNKISKKKIFSETINYDKNKLFQIHGLIDNFNISKNLHELETQYHSIQKEKNILKINENYEKNSKNKKILIFSQNLKNYKHSLFFYANTSKVKNLINEINSLQKTDTKELIKSNTQPFLFYDSKNSIEWKKLISQKILLSIANKNNQAEIYLKPENLGSIYIKINMKNDKATLDFISDHKEIRTFLDNHISFLRHSLAKNGIKLGKVNILGALKNKNIKNYKNIFDLDKFQKKFDFHKKNTNIENNSIDIYI